MVAFLALPFFLVVLAAYLPETSKRNGDIALTVTVLVIAALIAALVIV